MIKTVKNWYNSLDNNLNDLFFIGGPAGSGKTTSLLYLIKELNLSLNDCAFLAYTGKATSVLNKKGLPAKTVHREIYICSYDEERNRITIELKTKLDNEYKLIIVDEFSMISSEMLRDLKTFHIPVIGVGDPYQLDPIFGNNIIDSFSDSNKFVLTEVMRTDVDSILYYSDKIRTGKVDKNYFEKLYNLQRKDILKLSDNIFVTRRNNLKKIKNSLMNSDIILTATNKEKDKFNQIMRKIHKYKNELVRGEKVVVKKNYWGRAIEDPNLGPIFLTNGLTGNISEIQEEMIPTIIDTLLQDRPRFKINFIPEGYSLNEGQDNLPQITPFVGLNITFDQTNKLQTKNVIIDYAYAMTVHTAQGSEWDNIIINLSDSNYMKDEIWAKWAYTSFTRAKQNIILLI